VARVKAVLRRCERRAGGAAEVGGGGSIGGGSALTVGGLVVDPERREVLIDGEVVDVTRSEFELLATMVSQPGRVFTRLQLLEAASGDAFELDRHTTMMSARPPGRALMTPRGGGRSAPAPQPFLAHSARDTQAPAYPSSAGGVSGSRSASSRSRGS
jgi:Transcriptional regulatory protein, C terminal